MNDSAWLMYFLGIKYQLDSLCEGHTSTSHLILSSHLLRVRPRNA